MLNDLLEHEKKKRDKCKKHCIYSASLMTEMSLPLLEPWNNPSQINGIFLKFSPLASLNVAAFLVDSLPLSTKDFKNLRASGKRSRLSVTKRPLIVSLFVITVA